MWIALRTRVRLPSPPAFARSAARAKAVTPETPQARRRTNRRCETTAWQASRYSEPRLCFTTSSHLYHCPFEIGLCSAKEGGMAVSAVWRLVYLLAPWPAEPRSTPTHTSNYLRLVEPTDQRDALCPSPKIQKQAAFGINNEETPSASQAIINSSPSRTTSRTPRSSYYGAAATSTFGPRRRGAPTHCHDVVPLRNRRFVK